MTDEDDVRALLAAVTPAPSHVDLERAVRDGQARTRRRRYASLGAVAATVAALAAVPVTTDALRGGSRTHDLGTAPPSTSAGTGTTATGGACQISALRVPAGLPAPSFPELKEVVQATVVDPSGRYIGGQAMTRTEYAPILWTDGKPKLVPVPSSTAHITGINAHGVVVGSGAVLPSETGFVFRYAAGRYTQLSIASGNPVWHYTPPQAGPAVNGNGDIVATVAFTDDTTATFLWPAGSDRAHRVNLPSAARVSGINDSGTMVGEVYSDRNHPRAYAWDAGGAAHALSTPAGYRSLVYAVRGDLAVGVLIAPDSNGKQPLPSTSGYYPDASPEFHTVIWNLRTGTRTELYRGVEWPAAVNASSWLVLSDFGQFATTRSTLLRHGQAVSLRTLASGTTNQVLGVSDNGTAVGSSVSGAGAAPGTGASGTTQQPRLTLREVRIRPVTWHC
jgi:hypothetical protein